MDPKLQSLLGELEKGLGSVMRKQENSSARGGGDTDDSLGGKYHLDKYIIEKLEELSSHRCLTCMEEHNFTIFSMSMYNTLTECRTAAHALQEEDLGQGVTAFDQGARFQRALQLIIQILYSLAVITFTTEGLSDSGD